MRKLIRCNLDRTSLSAISITFQDEIRDIIILYYKNLHEEKVFETNILQFNKLFKILLV